MPFFKLTNDKVTLFPWVRNLIWVVVGIFVFVTGQEVPHNSPDAAKWNIFFYKGVLFYGFFSLFELLILAICIGIFINLKPKIKYGNNKERFFYFSTLIMYVFLMANPNNEPQTFSVFGMPLLNQLQYYVYFFLMYCFFFIKPDQLMVILRQVGIAFLFFVLIRSIILILGYFFGRIHVLLFDVRSILIEEDTLIHLVLAQLIAAALYIKNRKRTFAVLWLMIFFIELLSFRRSGFLLMLLSNVSLVGIYLLKISNPRYRAFAIPAMAVSVFLISLFIPSLSLSDRQEKYFYRYFGAFIKQDVGEEYQQNEHIDQSNIGFLLATQKATFWGNGMASVKKKVELSYKGNTGIHNAYVSSLIEYGFINFFYHFIIFIFAIGAFISLIREKSKNKEYLLIKSAIVLFTLFFYVNAWVLIFQNFVNMNMLFVRVVLFALIFNLTEENYHYLVSSRLKPAQ